MSSLSKRSASNQAWKNAQWKPEVFLRFMPSQLYTSPQTSRPFTRNAPGSGALFSGRLVATQSGAFVKCSPTKCGQLAGSGGRQVTSLGRARSASRVGINGRWRDGARRGLHLLQRQTRPEKQNHGTEKNKKHPPCFLSVATIVNRKTRGIFAWDVVKERTLETMQPLVDRMFSLVPQVHQFYSDGFSTYKELVYRQR